MCSECKKRKKKTIQTLLPGTHFPEFYVLLKWSWVLFHLRRNDDDKNSTLGVEGYRAFVQLDHAFWDHATMRSEC